MSTSTIYYSYEEIRTRQKSIPPDLGFSARSFIETGSEIPLEEGSRQDQQIPEVAPLWAVHAGEKLFHVSRPLRVHVFRDGDLFFAENETLLVCGTGESAWEAVEDLESHIIHFYKYYQELPPDGVIGDAKRLKDLYENLLIEDQ